MDIGDERLSFRTATSTGQRMNNEPSNAGIPVIEESEIKEYNGMELQARFIVSQQFLRTPVEPRFVTF